MFKIKSFKPLPEGSVVAPGGKKARLPGGKTVDLSKDGRVIYLSESWYCKIGGKRTILLPSRSDSKELEAKLQADARRVDAGLPSELAQKDAASKSLAGLINEYLAELAGAGRADSHLRTTKPRLSLLADAGLKTVADLQRTDAGEKIAKALRALAIPSEPVKLPKGDEFAPLQLRTLLGISGTSLAKLAAARGVAGAGKGKAKRYTRAEAEKLIADRGGGKSNATSNGYRISLKSFFNWLVRNDLLAKAPRMPMPLKEQARRPRRALTKPEVEALVAAAEAGGTIAGLEPEARAVLYQVAFQSLLRARALRELTVGDLHLAAASPFISVRSETDKNGIARRCSISKAVASRLKRLVKGRSSKELVWQLPESLAAVMRKDLKAAGIPFRNDSGVVDFHSLRHSGASHFIAAGVSPLIVAKAGGWTSLTMLLKRYGHLTPDDIASVLGPHW
jgi:integrase